MPRQHPPKLQETMQSVSHSRPQVQGRPQQSCREPLHLTQVGASLQECCRRRFYIFFCLTQRGWRV